MAVTDGFVDAVLESPVGVALLAQLETRVRYPEGCGLVLETDAGSVSAAVRAVSDMSWGALVELAVLTGWRDVGPWIADAAETVAVAYRQAEARAPIAEALADRFGADLHQPIERETQQWWTTGGRWVDRLAPLFRNYERVYGAGQFTWAGLWTVSDPPEVAHAGLAAAWEFEDGAISRWRLPVLPGARVLEVHRPADWARLVSEHPDEAVDGQEGWELPGPNQRAEVSMLVAVGGQRATRTAVRRHLVPDWRSVAAKYDGVHLSWAGFITAEGCITDLDGGDVAMLRYWFSERTHWVADVFGEPEPEGPHTAGNDGPIDVRLNPDRRRRDDEALRQLLGR